MENKVQSHYVVCSIVDHAEDKLFFFVGENYSHGYLVPKHLPLLVGAIRCLSLTLQAAVLFTSKQFGLCCRSRFQKPYNSTACSTVHW